MARPLDGLKVLDLTRLLPGPFATLLLADLGATIIKVEEPKGGDYARHFPPQGGRMSGVFAALNRDKQGIALDLKRPEGRDALLRLAATADVLVESFRPGVLDRLGLGWSALHAANPRLIVCAITGFGQTGPLAERAGHDLDYLAIAGLAGLTGHAGQVVQPGLQAADIAGGALYGVVGILAALQQRATTGLGQRVDASMTDGVAGLGLLVHAKQHLDGKPTAPGEDDLAGGRLCYRTWPCADGRWLAVGALEPKFWGALCAAVGRPDLFPAGYAEGARRDAAEAEISALFAARSRDAWVADLADHDVCVEPVLGPEEARVHPHAVARGLFGTHHHPGEGATFLHQFPNPRLLPDHPPPAEVQPAPQLGEHTDAVLRAAGFSEAEVADLRAAGVLGKPPRSAASP
ncbi:MAG: CoA transferase [Myxococcales bacterium]|nr:CoA transferase [Myxococcales bacterium]